MKKVEAYQVILEITRQCNMNCSHCLRGDSQNIKISHEIIDKTLAGISDISYLTFTGGEPALNVEAMEYTLQVCKEKEIPVHGFYLVTNGKLVTDRFLKVISDWKVYCDICNYYLPEYLCHEELKEFRSILEEEQYTGLALSSDIYHEEIPLENILKLNQFSFFKFDKFAGKKFVLINMGRAENLKYAEKREIPEYELNANCFETSDFLGEIYVNAKGDILSCCDISYEKQEIYKKGSVLNENWIELLWELENEEE